MATQILLRRGTAAEWAAANPILADGEPGVEKGTMYYKIGNGVNNWNSLPYASLQLANTATVIDITGQVSAPAAPGSGHLKIFSMALAGKMLLRQLEPSGANTPLQPALFQVNIMEIVPSTSTTIGSIGISTTTVGTISHPAATEIYGYMANFLTASTANITAGVSTSAPTFFRGSVPGANGFFFKARLGFPDASYNETGAGTGSRIFVGMTSNTTALMVSAATATGDYCGFSRHSENGLRVEANWQFITRDNATTNLIDTGLPFIASKAYDFYIFCEPQGTVIYWRIDNLTDGTTAEGSTATNLPTANVAMRAGFQLGTVNATGRNIRMQHGYFESKR